MVSGVKGLVIADSDKDERLDGGAGVLEAGGNRELVDGEAGDVWGEREGRVCVWICTGGRVRFEVTGCRVGVRYDVKGLRLGLRLPDEEDSPRIGDLAGGIML